MRAALPYTAEELEALRGALLEGIRERGRLRLKGERARMTPEDLAQEGIALLLEHVAKKGVEAVGNPVPWMLSALDHDGSDFARYRDREDVAGDASDEAFELLRAAASQEEVDELIDRAYDNRRLDAAVAGLGEHDAMVIAARFQGMTEREVEEDFGLKHNTVQRLGYALHERLYGEAGDATAKRRRSQAVAYHLGHVTAAQRAKIEAAMATDFLLRAQIRGLQRAGEHAAALYPMPLVAAKLSGHSPGFLDRAAALGDRLREHAYSLVGRSTGHETDTATGIAGGGAGAGLATKAIVAACIGGSAAAGVGGACVATGVVDLPGSHNAPGAESTTAQQQTVATTPNLTSPQATTPTEDPAPIDPTTTTVEKPVQQVTKELYGGGSSGGSSGSTSGSRDFAAPAASSSSSGGGGGGSSGTRDNFGP